jgi:class 3 adenylate cyclase
VADSPAHLTRGDGADDATVRTFLLADFRGYTRFTREQGDDAASSLAARFAALVRETVPLFGGELLELRGDEALCVFGSARQALRAAVELQRRLRTPAPDGWVFPLAVGMGLDAGEAVPTEGGYRGAALNMAGRLVSLAGPGEILATERLAGLASQVDGVRWSAPRSVRLKGLERPERIVRVTSDKPLPPPPRPPRPPAARPVRRMMVFAIVLAVAAAAGLALLFGRSNGDSASQIAARAQSLAVIDANQGRVVADVALPDHPESLAIGAGRVWVGLAGGSVAPVQFGASHADAPIGIAYDPGIWRTERGQCGRSTLALSI